MIPKEDDRYALSGVRDLNDLIKRAITRMESYLNGTRVTETTLSSAAYESLVRAVSGLTRLPLSIGVTDFMARECFHVRDGDMERVAHAQRCIRLALAVWVSSEDTVRLPHALKVLAADEGVMDAVEHFTLDDGTLAMEIVKPFFEGITPAMLDAIHRHIHGKDTVS